jgi:hypothetical protein
MFDFNRSSTKALILDPSTGLVVGKSKGKKKH